MIWSAASYLTDSPSAGSSSPICLFIVFVQPLSAIAATAISNNLEDMAIILLEAVRLGLGHAAAWRWRRWRRRNIGLDERSRRGRYAGVGAPVQQKIRFVRGTDTIGRHL